MLANPSCQNPSDIFEARGKGDAQTKYKPRICSRRRVRANLSSMKLSCDESRSHALDDFRPIEFQSVVFLCSEDFEFVELL